MIALIPPRAAAVAAPAVGMAVTAMLSMQLALALSRPLTAEIGAPAVTWLRMVMAALLLTAWTRPRLAGLGREAWVAAVLLGAVLALMSAAFFAAVGRLPLGMVSTLSFLGPLSVAVFAAGPARLPALGMAAMAGAGVVLIVAPAGGGWHVDALGLGFALMAATGWALYILLTRRVGALFSGRDGLCLSLVTASVLLMPFGLPALAGGISAQTVLGAAGLAVLAPVLTCALEMAALRKLGPQPFGILMSLEPAIAALLGLILLQEVPDGWQILGLVLVVAASALAVLVVRQD